MMSVTTVSRITVEQSSHAHHVQVEQSSHAHHVQADMVGEFTACTQSTRIQHVGDEFATCDEEFAGC